MPSFAKDFIAFRSPNGLHDQIARARDVHAIQRVGDRVDRADLSVDDRTTERALQPRLGELGLKGIEAAKA